MVVTVAISHPPNRIIMVAIRGDEFGNGMGSVLSGLMVCIKDGSRMLRAAWWRPALVAAAARQVQLVAK